MLTVIPFVWHEVATDNHPFRAELSKTAFDLAPEWCSIK